MLQDAVLRNILVIGEAAQQVRKVLPEAEQRFPTLPLAKRAATRNRLIHDYQNIDLQIAWNVATIELSSLKVAVEVVLDSWPEDLIEPN